MPDTRPDPEGLRLVKAHLAEALRLLNRLEQGQAVGDTLPPAYHRLTPRQRQILTRERTKHLPPPDLDPQT